jgi:hypothetical protein
MIRVGLRPVRGLGGDPQFRRAGRRRSSGWIADRFAWAVLTLVVVAVPRVGVGAEAEVAGASSVPIQVVRFDRGSSSKEMTAAVIRGGRSLYSIDARAGQRLSVSIAAAEDNAVFQIYPPGAQAEHRAYSVEIVGPKALPGAEEGQDAKSWSGVLPTTGVYLVVVGPTYGNATYTLKVAIR